MFKNWFLLAFLMAILLSCQPQQKHEDVVQYENVNRYFVQLDESPLRTAPSLKGNIVTKLKAGSSVYHLGEVGREMTVMILDSLQICEPWLRVKTEKGAEGWIYGARLDHSKEEQLYSEVRLTALLGRDLKDSLDVFKEKSQWISTPEAFENFYHRAQTLQDDLNRRLEQVSFELTGTQGIPDLFWLKDVVPGFVPQLVAEGTVYHLFLDFRWWLVLSDKTTDDRDDGFVSICIKVFPSDSIEYFFPGWTIQTWDYGGHSLLGRGIHYNILKQLESYGKKSNLFERDLSIFKQKIIDDITLAEVSYWEGQDKIMAELDSIISMDPGFFTEEDLVGLKVRNNQFSAPEKFGILINQRSGE
ncbi:MAG: SH3 domain-containing protein [Bacteroidetes bacterium]|nr:MAG: SH3 domain-containing protein [Bacteroidota bacterium]